jgi:hypothetical protein
MKIENIENLVWKWKNKLKPLGKMSDNELISLRNYVNYHPGKHGVFDTNFWSNSVKELLQYRKINRGVNLDIVKSKLVFNIKSINQYYKVTNK